MEPRGPRSQRSGHMVPLVDFQFSPKGHMLAAVCGDQIVKLCNVAALTAAAR